MSAEATDFATEQYAVRYWPEHRDYYVVNRLTDNRVGPTFQSQEKAERWALRCQDDVDAGRQVGERSPSQAAFGAHLRTLRERRLLTLEALADRIGVPWQTIQRWEVGTRYPRLASQHKLCQALEVSVAELLGDTER